jgi:predicted CxxxxCH...CXXCH cytochrome family protein
MKILDGISSFGTIVATLALLTSSCSDLKNDLPAPTSGGLSIHPPGWKTSDSPDFHGEAIREMKWDMRSCQTCHGSTYRGGTSGVACTRCHTSAAGPENCNTCHGSSTSPAPPRDLSKNTSTAARGVGAHQVHLKGTARARAVTCADCHTIPDGVYGPGHIDADNRAEVMMQGYLATLPTNSGQIVPAPSYNPSSLGCSNTYCHGTFKNGNLTNVVTWTNPTTAACGTCHGDVNATDPARIALPKTAAQGGTHPDNISCSFCHGAVVNANRQIINASKHIDGKVSLFGSDITF